jgi:putative transposase
MKVGGHVTGDLAVGLGDKKMKHVRSAPYHPQTQSKIERWHQTLKNRILLENYSFPGDLEAQIETFIITTTVIMKVSAM